MESLSVEINNHMEEENGSGIENEIFKGLIFHTMIIIVQFIENLTCHPMLISLHIFSCNCPDNPTDQVAIQPYHREEN